LVAVTAARGALVIGLGLLLGAPLVQPFGRLLQADSWQHAADDLGRVSILFVNSLLLVGGAILLAVPAGTFLAVLLFRSTLPGRLGLALIVLLLFVPLPILVSSWQGLLGSGGLLPLSFWATGVDRPWATGWGPAVWVHALAALPWVTCIVGLGLAWVEPELEQEASLLLPPWRVIWRVTLPRCRASIFAAMLFVGLQTAGEIGVTDMMLVATLAEEIYTQLTLGEPTLGRTLVLALPGLAILIGVLSAAGARLERSLPPLPVLLRPSGAAIVKARWPSVFLVTLMLVMLIVPFAGLVWRLGEAGLPRAWSLIHAERQLAAETRLLGVPFLKTLATALVSGVLVTGLALVACWLARESRPLRLFLLVLLTTAWVMPAPFVGIGLKEVILRLVPDAQTLQELPDGSGRQLLEAWARLLYDGPSPIPVIWAHVIRFLPPATLFLWPVVRLIPRGLFESARLDGAGPVRELLLVVFPETRRAAGVVALAITALALGEIGAAGRVETPRWEVFARLLFDRMHYGVDASVAALSLLMLAAVAAAVVLFAVTIGIFKAIAPRR
jgi:iron(III) transport system permease protein